MRNIFITFLFVLFAAIGAFGFMGCVASTPVVQYPDNTSITTVYTYDDVDAVQSNAAPDELLTQFNDSLTARNLKVQNVDFEKVKAILTSIRDTERRLNALQNIASSSNYLVLTELSTEFYSALSGRYRWDVHAKMTIIDTRTHETLTQSFTVPAALMYAHETGVDAINAVKSELDRKLTSLVDQFLKGVSAGVQPVAVVEAPAGASPGVMTRSVLAPSADKAEAIYFIMVDRFFNAQNENDFDVNKADEAGWHGGDLAGIQQQLPYLRDLGITQLWLSPIFSAAHEKFFGNAAFHAYWTYDLNEIDTHFGTTDDLVKLAKAAQDNGMGLILDFVVNHVGYGSPLVEQKPDWFHAPLTIEDWNDPVQLTTRQVHGLPDLNQDNPDVYNYLAGAAQKWLSLPNITGYRLDAVKHVGLDFWTKFNTALLAQKPDMILLGEYFDGDPKKVDEVQKKGHFTHLFDFPLAFALRDVFCDHKTLDYLANILPNDLIYTNPENMVTFLDNHDMPRFISTCHGDQAAMRRALTVMMSLRGIPSLYYGTEVPLAGDKEPQNRGDMTFGNAQLYDAVKADIARRNAYPVLRNGKTGTIHFENDFIVIARDNGAQQALVLVSESGSEKAYTLPEGTWFDADTREPVDATVAVAPRSVRVLINQVVTKPLITGKTRQITFKTPNDGATYALVGSAPEFGQWNPANAPRPVNGELTLTLPAQSVIAYKPVKLDPSGAVQWADGPNRAVFTETDQVVNVQF